MYINLHLPLFSFVYLFLLFFPLNIFVSFVFTALFPTWHLALLLFSSLCFSYFCSGKYTFWFPLFAGSIYCTLFFVLFWFCLWVCMFMCIFGHTFSCSYKTLPLHWAFAVLWSFPFFHFFFFSLFYNFNFLNLLYFSTFIPLFAFPTVLFPLQLIFNVHKSSSTSI